MQTSAERPRVLAMLGPTNTGKTHFAIERMLGHDSGMIGFPLRLLARENYDRIVGLKGKSAVALITGEEKILPPRARYFVCTVESMPLDRAVSCLAVDEIQLAADPERGHVFTDRLLHARGTQETILLGSDTIRHLVRRLLPDTEFLARPRLSSLTYTGARKLTRLPRRSAVVAFSAQDVYALAELIRRQRGGAAVVMGALSPRARNAQVAMFQSGEVDHLVATDAIGMGLNMDLDHVAFADRVKFDGRRPRLLSPAELAQIAGRAGRHMSDGTFGSTAALAGLEDEVVEAVESHRFAPLTRLFWRNAELRFRSVEHLLRDLEAPSPQPYLVRKGDADDQRALRALWRIDRIARRADHPEAVRLLWDVCQVPDFRKELTDSHAGLLVRLFLELSGRTQRLDADWVAASIERLDRTQGDIDTLTQRMAAVRTWTYVTHRPDWVDDPESWQERTRAIEDRLSDALHDRLTQRFVDRRATILTRHLKESRHLLAAVRRDGSVLVEGEDVGKLEGLVFRPAASRSTVEARVTLGAARRVLPDEIGRRVDALVADDDTAFDVDTDGRLLWRAAPVARLRAGPEALKPLVEPVASDFLESAQRGRIEERLRQWTHRRIVRALGPLLAARDKAPPGALSGLVFRLCEGLGTCRRQAADAQVASLSQGERKLAFKLGIRLGTECIFMPALLKPQALALRALLWGIHAEARPLPAPPPAGHTSVVADGGPAAAFHLAVGFLPLGGRAVRCDIVERVAVEARRLGRDGPFQASDSMRSLIGCSQSELASVVAALGYRVVGTDDGLRFVPRRRPGRPRPRRPEVGGAFHALAPLTRGR